MHTSYPHRTVSMNPMPCAMCHVAMCDQDFALAYSTRAQGTSTTGKGHTVTVLAGRNVRVQVNWTARRVGRDGTRWVRVPDVIMIEPTYVGVYTPTPTRVRAYIWNVLYALCIRQLLRFGVLSDMYVFHDSTPGIPNNSVLPFTVPCGSPADLVRKMARGAGQKFDFYPRVRPKCEARLEV